MCASIGVDPLASGKGFWSNMLDIGDFYYELAVQIVEVKVLFFVIRETPNFLS
jgi:ESCRT-II complex subunit VPS22